MQIFKKPSRIDFQSSITLNSLRMVDIPTDMSAQADFDMEMHDMYANELAMPQWFQKKVA